MQQQKKTEDFAVIFHRDVLGTHFNFIPLSFVAFTLYGRFVLKVYLIENTIGAHLLEHFLHQNAIKSIINVSTLHNTMPLVCASLYKFRLVARNFNTFTIKLKSES